MYQSTTPFLSQTIWPRWASRQFLTVPIVQTLLPVTFGYSLSSRKNLEAVVMRQFRRWMRLWRRSHAHTRGLPWGLSEVVGTVQQMHCSRRRLLRRGLEFHACTIIKSVHTKKVWKLVVGCRASLKVLELSEIQTASSRIWVTVHISYNYANSTFRNMPEWSLYV